MFAWICPKCGKEIPPQYDGCPEWCPEFEKQRAYLKQAAPPAVESTSPVIKNLPKLEGSVGGGPTFTGTTYTGATYKPGAMLPPPRPAAPDVNPEAMRYRPAPSAIAYETPLAPSSPPPASMPPLSDIRSQQQHPAVTEPPAERSKEMNPFLVTLLAAVVFLALGYAAFKYYEQSKTPMGFATDAADSSGATGGHRLNRILSFSGMKFAAAKNKQIEAEFVLVNGSGAQTPTFSGTVEIRPKDAAATDPALISFALSKLSLGPHESQQLRIPVNTALKPYELPDGSMVRADFTITEPTE